MWKMRAVSTMRSVLAYDIMRCVWVWWVFLKAWLEMKPGYIRVGLLRVYCLPATTHIKPCCAVSRPHPHVNLSAASWVFEQRVFLWSFVSAVDIAGDVWFLVCVCFSGEENRGGFLEKHVRRALVLNGKVLGSVFGLFDADVVHPKFGFVEYAVVVFEHFVKGVLCEFFLWDVVGVAGAFRAGFGFGRFGLGFWGSKIESAVYPHVLL